MSVVRPGHWTRSEFPLGSNLGPLIFLPTMSRFFRSLPVESAKLSVTDIIAAAEKLQAGASVLDVSFEPKDGKPAYAVRTYAKEAGEPLYITLA